MNRDTNNGGELFKKEREHADELIARDIRTLPEGAKIIFDYGAGHMASLAGKLGYQNTQGIIVTNPIIAKSNSVGKMCP